MSLGLAVAVGGAAGALARYGLDGLIERRTESVFPWATFAINMAGCLAVGFVLAALVDRHRAPDWLRAGLVVGFCGAFTTFSTFAQETLDLFEAKDVAVGALSIAASVGLGVAAVFVGARLGRLA